ncbi:MAG: uroporphyrinogen-III C-methyltransferase [Micrococcales bacterium]|nr:uroporphyrinogen-III C-methyltransferase [Micrococcales bacterium]
MSFLPPTDLPAEPLHSQPEYPLFLCMRGKLALVVGGGPVAERRVAGLLQASAEVLLVSPWATEKLQDLAAQGVIAWKPREFDTADLDGVWLVHACTGDAPVDESVVRRAESLRIWSVRASAAGSSPAWTAATERTEDGVQFAVKAGGDPLRAVALRNFISELAAEGALPLRRQRPGSGQVFLVGGGPGDPDLLTVRARRLLSLADVIITDRLAPVHSLDGVANDVEIIDVGKAPGKHSLAQSEINDLLVKYADAGQIVVRLKGGDPFVLGRGGEEALHCLHSGVDVAVVPGVTSATSVPAAAGIPVTHRGLSDSFMVLSSHSGADDVVRRAGSTPADTTLIMLMGVRELANTTAGLIAAGRDPQTPAAIVAAGWTSEQETISAPISEIAELAETSGIASPAVIVVGPVAALRDNLGDLGVPSLLAGHGALG